MAQTWIPNDPVEAEAYFSARERHTTGPMDVHEALETQIPIILVDVRAPGDFEKEHIPGAVHLPKERWSTCAGLQRDKVNVVYCYTEVCHLALRAAIEFARHGFPVRVMDGGIQSWKDYGYGTEGSKDLGAQWKAGEPSVPPGEASKAGLDPFTEARMESRHSSSWPHS